MKVIEILGIIMVVSAFVIMVGMLCAGYGYMCYVVYQLAKTDLFAGIAFGSVLLVFGLVAVGVILLKISGLTDF